MRAMQMSSNLLLQSDATSRVHFDGVNYGGFLPPVETLFEPNHNIYLRRATRRPQVLVPHASMPTWTPRTMVNRHTDGDDMMELEAVGVVDALTTDEQLARFREGIHVRRSLEPMFEREAISWYTADPAAYAQSSDMAARRAADLADLFAARRARRVAAHKRPRRFTPGDAWPAYAEDFAPVTPDYGCVEL